MSKIDSIKKNVKATILRTQYSVTKKDIELGYKQIGALSHPVEIVTIDGIEYLPLSVKCRCGHYRSVHFVKSAKFLSGAFVVDGCPIMHPTRHADKSHKAIGTGAEFDIKDLAEAEKQIRNSYNENWKEL